MTNENESVGDSTPHGGLYDAPVPQSPPLAPPTSEFPPYRDLRPALRPAGATLRGATGAAGDAGAASARGLRAGIIGGLVGAVVAGGVAFGTVKATDHDAVGQARPGARPWWPAPPP